MKKNQINKRGADRDGLHNLLTARKEYLETLITKKSKALEEAPEGRLRISKSGNYYQYYLVTDQFDTNGTYIPKKNQKLAAAIAQKDYDKKIIKEAQKELLFLGKYKNYIRSNGIEDIYENLITGRQQLVTPIELSVEEFAKAWEQVEYTMMPVDKELKFYSNNRVHVRSKSELIIANLLEQYGVPFRYEYPVTLKAQGMVRPDFLCLNKRTRSEFIWEHFGMMDNISYANKNVAKINLYSQSGYITGENLIMTFETSQTPLDSNIVVSTIKKYLI